MCLLNISKISVDMYTSVIVEYHAQETQELIWQKVTIFHLPMRMILWMLVCCKNYMMQLRESKLMCQYVDIQVEMNMRNVNVLLSRK